MGLGFGGLNGSLGGSGSQGGGLHYNRTPSAASPQAMPSISPAPTTPSNLRKPLLPSSVLTKPLGSIGGSLGFSLARSRQAKQQKPLFPDRVKVDVGPSGAAECGGLLGIAIDIEPTGQIENGDLHSDGSDGSSGDAGGKGGGRGVLRRSSGQAEGESLEDMSLSSVSSLDRGDTSEEFLDDLDSLGDVLSDGEMPDNRTLAALPKTHLHSFPNEAIDWDAVDVAGKSTELKGNSIDCLISYLCQLFNPVFTCFL